MVKCGFCIIATKCIGLLQLTRMGALNQTLGMASIYTASGGTIWAVGWMTAG
jgi:hypothetical protein